MLSADQRRSRAQGIAPTVVGGSKKHGGPDLGPTRAREAWKKLGVDGLGIADEAPGPEFRVCHITMAEDFGVEDRGSFYDPVGALRDVVQNHLLQVVGLIASEPPSAADADGLRDKRVEVFRAIPPADANRYVRGQYDGYLSVPGVSPGSQTETFAALRLEIDNWRWSGVPFFIRAGKALAAHATEVRIIFKPPPRLVFARHTPHPDEFILRIDSHPGADMMVQAKQPGAQSTRTVDLSLIFSEELGDAPESYERLLGDALRGTPGSSSGRTGWSRRGASCSPC